MKKKLEMIRTTVKKAMADYDPTEEFGINKETYEKIIGGVDEFINELIRKNDDSAFKVSGVSDDDEPDFLNDPEYEICYEKHDISPEIQMKRIFKRNGAEAAERFKSIWIPMEETYFNELWIREQEGVHVLFVC